VRRLLLGLALAIAPLASCATIPASPGAIAPANTLDERIGIAATTAYSAATRAVRLARQAGFVSDADWPRVQQIDRQAFAAVEAIRSAYEARNAASYAAAVINALRGACQLTVASGAGARQC